MTTRSVGAIAIALFMAVGTGAVTTDTSSPAIVWQHAAPGWGEPAVDATTAYFLTRHHEVAALDLDTGRLRWRVSTGGDGEVPWGSRLVVVGQRVVTGDGAIRAFDRASGRAVWRFAPRNLDTPGPFIGDTKGEVLYAGSVMGAVYALDAGTGQLAWSYRVGVDVGGPKPTVFAPAAVPRGVAATFTTYGKALSGGVICLDERGRRLWQRRLPKGVGAAGAPVVAAGTVVVPRTDGLVAAFDLDSGAPVWELPPVQPTGRPQPERDVRSLAVAENAIVVGSLTGELVAYDLGTRRERWRYRTKEGISLLRLRAGAGTVYAPYTDDSIVALDASTGTERWRAGGEALPFEWPPAVAGARVVVAGTRALVALDQSAGSAPSEKAHP
jgi:outer membrane protein assembly factor BamB